MLKLGIVATVADAGDSIYAFIQYHQKIGFQYIYIFIDDNDLDVFDTLQQYSGVKAFLKDDELQKSWQQFFSLIDDQKLPLIDREVMVRQELNFYMAYNLAREHGVDWLLHIDLDELFYPNGHDLNAYFSQLQLGDFRAITCLNYESISTLLESKNIYLSSTYFKVNHFRNRHWFYNQEQKKFLSQHDWLKEKYFLFYQNGKSCVSTYGNKIEFYDVHSIMGDGLRKIGKHSDPIILHFPCARLSDFIKKYQRLGDFPDDWLGFPRAGLFLDRFHLQARDFMRDAAPADWELFYRTHCLLPANHIETLCQLGLVTVIDFHQRILSNV